MTVRKVILWKAAALIRVCLHLRATFKTPSRKYCEAAFLLFCPLHVNLSSLWFFLHSFGRARRKEVLHILVRGAGELAVTLTKTHANRKKNTHTNTHIDTVFNSQPD